jgi:hypothetical protein
MLFNWVKNGGHFRRECRLKNGIWLVVDRSNGGYYWAVNSCGGSLSNPYIKREEMAENMKEAKQKAESEYLKTSNEIASLF